MTIDVTAERVLPLPPERVAAYAMGRRIDYVPRVDAYDLPHPEGTLARIRVEGGSSVRKDLRDLERRLTERTD
ncbi:hypothetical protein ACQEWB_05120 [Streptomyces sp. CA-249302]|uniref:hypothetical protein n=1 Tax=Streptomyces sp. CA-249302 TaxID=3240058 RepID=UPI003D8A6B85